MTNILYIHQSAELYGSDKTLLYLVTQLDPSLYCPIVVLPGEGPLKDALQAAQIKVIVSPVIKLHRKMFTPAYLMSLPLEVIRSMRHIKKALAGTKIHIVQSNTLAVLLGVFLSRKLKAKHLWHVHEIITHPKFISNLYPKILDRFADVVVCNSNATLENLRSRNPKLKAKLQLIHNGMQPKPPHTPTAKPALGYAGEDLVISLVGRISRLKGHQLLLGVFHQYFKDRPNVKLLFTGSPVPGQEFYLEDLEKQIADFQLGGRVKILPFQNDLSAVWDVTDIAVSPSTEAESFGLVALEAMFAKIPVVATDLGGFKEVVVHNQTGLLFENKNGQALHQALETLIADAALRKDLGEQGYQRAVSVFSLEKYIDSFVHIYKQMRDNLA